MFGSKRKQREAAESAARLASFTTWFATVERLRPAGSQTPTDDLLRAAGDPYAFLGPGADPADVPFLTSRYVAQEWADRLARKAILADDPDARSRSAFWRSVSGWL